MIETEDLPSCGLIQHEDSPTKLSDGPIQDDDFMSDGLIKDEHDPLYGEWSIQGWRFAAVVNLIVAQSSQFAGPLGTDPGLNSRITVCLLISTKKKRKKRAGGERMVEHSPTILPKSSQAGK